MGLIQAPQEGQSWSSRTTLRLLTQIVQLCNGIRGLKGGGDIKVSWEGNTPCLRLDGGISSGRAAVRMATIGSGSNSVYTVNPADGGTSVVDVYIPSGTTLAAGVKVWFTKGKTHSESYDYFGGVLDPYDAFYHCA